MMRRRDFISLLGGATVAWPLAARAQQRAKIPRIGIIDDSPIWNAFRQGLRDLGYLEGQNIAFEYRYADGLPDRLAQAAAELVRRPVDVIAVYGTPPAYAAKQATTTIPTVIIGIGDPVGAGLVPSLAHPGGNITGNTILGPDVASKRLQLLKEGVPASRVALLWNPENASHSAYVEEMRTAASTLGVTLISVPVSRASEFDGAFAAMMRERPDAFVMTADPLHQLHIKRIVDFLAQNRLLGMFQLRENVNAGALMSYGASLPDLFRRGAAYVHRILQGTRPADLPVEQAVKFELVINLKTAKAAGLTIPESFILRADEVIECGLALCGLWLMLGSSLAACPLQDRPITHQRSPPHLPQSQASMTADCFAGCTVPAKRGTISGTSDFRHQRGELVGALAPALVEAHLLVPLAVGDGPMAHAGGVARLAADVLEGEDHRHERLLGRLPRRGIGVRDDEPLVFDHFEIDAPVGQVLAVGTAHHHQVGAARPHVEFGHRRGVGQRREPLLEQPGVGPRAEHLGARRIDEAGQDEFAVRRRGGFGGGGHGRLRRCAATQKSISRM